MHYRAHLSWLEGYPMAANAGVLEWQCVPRRGELAVVRIGAMELSGARRALNEIRREHGVPGEDLPSLERVETALVLAGQACRGGIESADPWPHVSARARTAARQLSAPKPLRSMATSLAWGCLVAGDQAATFRWMAAHISELNHLSSILPETHAHRAVSVLARLACEIGDKHLGPLLGLMCRQELHDTATTEQPGSSPEARRKHSFGASLIELIDSLLPLAATPRARAVRLAVETAPVRWIEQWHDYHTARESWQRDKERLRPTATRKRLAPKPGKPPEPPPGLKSTTLIDTILAEATLNDEAAVARDELLAALPGECDVPGGRARALVIFHHLMKLPDSRVPVPVARAWATVLRSRPDAFALLDATGEFSSAALNEQMRRVYISHLVDLPPNASPRACIESLLRLLPFLRTPAWRRLLYLFADLVELGRDPDWAGHATAAAAPALATISVYHVAAPVVHLTSSLAGHSHDLFSSLISKLAGSEDIAADGVTALIEFLRSVDAEGVLRAELLAGNHQRAIRWTQVFAVLRPGDVKLVVPPKPDARGWIVEYPKPLRAELLNLAWLPDGKRRAHRLLRRALPGNHALKRELEQVRQRLAHSASLALQARETSLMGRLKSGTRLRARDLEKLSEKIRRASHRARVELLDSAIEKALFEAVSPRLRSTSKPDWWTRPDAIAIVAAISSLPTVERDLGYKLLAARCGEPPWLPWHEPRNQAFLKRIAAMGIRTEPWLDPSPLLKLAMGSRAITLAFESDPLEILLMGERFSTCLSLGSFNFYSAVVNAVDVNKRVLYARGQDGVVIGRCLLALTDQGRVLTFEPYAHNRDIGFDKLVADVARDLARRMNTHVAVSGPVTPLLAKRWYDDGPRDLTGQMAPLADGSGLRRCLTTVDPSELVALLETALAPYGVDETTLPRILRLPEVAKRPELAVALAPKVAAATYLPWETRVAVSALVHDAGEHTLARQVLHAARLWDWLIAPCPECGAGCYPNLDRCLQSVVKVDPALGLRALKRTRPRGVKRWDGETESRLLCAALALRGMGRTMQATRLLEQGMRTHLEGELGASFRTELARIA